MTFPRYSQLGDTSLPTEQRTIPNLKGEPFVVFRNATVDAESDTTIDLRAYNAVVIKTLVSGTEAVADVMLIDSETPTGQFLECTDPQGEQLAVTAPTQAMVICGAHYARIRLQNVGGTFGPNQGFTVICWPFVAAGQSNVSIGSFTLPPTEPLATTTNLTEVAGAGIGPTNPVPTQDQRLPGALGPNGGLRVESVSAPGGTQAVSAVDGALGTIGANADAAVVTNVAGTVSAKLRGLVALVASLIDSNVGLAVANQMILLATTAATLGIAAVYTQATAANNLLGFGRITASVFADQAGTLFVDQSADGGATWDVSSSFPVLAATAAAVSVEVIQPTGRLRYVNGAVAQGTFRLTGRLRRI